MPFEISVSLLVVRMQLNAPPKLIDSFINLTHFVINLSQSDMCLHTFVVVYLATSFQTLESIFEVFLIFINVCQTIECLQIFFVMLKALRKTGNRFFFSVQNMVKFPYQGDHAIILGSFLQIFEVILKSLLLFCLIKISGQPLVCLAKVWINFNDFSQATNGSFTIGSFECIQTTTITIIVEFSVKEACRLPQSSNMFGVKLDNLFIVIPTSFRIGVGCFKLLKQCFCLCNIIQIFHLLQHIQIVQTNRVQKSRQIYYQLQKSPLYFLSCINQFSFKVKKQIELSMFGEMFIQISFGLLVIGIELIAFPVIVQCFFNVSHRIVNMSNMTKNNSTQILTIHTFMKQLKSAFEISFVLVNLSQANQSTLSILIMVQTFGIAGFCLFFSVHRTIQISNHDNRIPIFRVIDEVFQIVLQRFFLVFITIFRQFFICQPKLRVDLDDLFQVFKSLLAILTVELVPRLAVASIIVITVVKACRLPQSSNMPGVQFNTFFVFQHGTFRIGVGCLELLEQGFCFGYIILIIHLLQHILAVAQVKVTCLIKYYRSCQKDHFHVAVQLLQGLSLNFPEEKYSFSSGKAHTRLQYSTSLGNPFKQDSCSRVNVCRKSANPKSIQVSPPAINSFSPKIPFNFLS